MKTYPAYKDSGVDWLGKIPEHWELARLGSVIQPFSKRNQPNLQVLSVYRDYGVIKKDSRDDNHNATSLDTSNYKVVHKGDLVINKMKAWQGSMGVSSYEGIVSPAYITCNVITENIDSNYLHKIMRSSLMIEEYKRISYGVRIGQWDMHWEDFKNVPILIPPIPEQTAIANFLDKTCGKLDTALAQKEKMIALLKERKQALIQKAVTQGLDENVAMKDSGVDWIGEIPEGWEVKKLKFVILKTFSGGTPSTENLKFWNGGIPWISSVDVKRDKIYDTARNISALGLSLSSANIAPKNSLILVTRSGILQHTFPISIVMKDMAINQDIKCLIFNKKVISNDFFQILIQGNNDKILIETRKQGATVESIEMEYLFNLPIPIPPIKEQEEIVHYIAAQSQKIDQAVQQQAQAIVKLKEYKASLVDSCVLGKVKVG